MFNTLLEIYFRFAIGTHWGFVFQSFAYQGSRAIHLFVAWIWLACFVGMTIATILQFKNSPAGSLRKQLIISAVSWVAYIPIWVLVSLPMRNPVVDVEMIRTQGLIFSVSGVIQDAFLVVALVFIIRAIKTIRIRNK